MTTSFSASANSAPESPVAIVTGGAGGGIGQGITQALARQGWSLLIIDLDDERLTAIADELHRFGTAIEVMATDITASGVAEAAVQRTLDKFGRLDALVNSAGVGLCKRLGDVSDAEFDRLIDTDLRAAFRFARAALPSLIASKGSIVSVGSVHAARSTHGYGAYAAAKAGLEALTRGIAIDYGALGVRANTIHPGLVVSPQTEALLGTFVPDPKAWIEAFSLRNQLLPEIVTPEQVGDVVAWLVSAQSAAITGQAITIDAGTSAMLMEREKS
jgi:NAD(P)-dependent dehydrogenase (short-subunit alcohol dehydrogenase family)